MEKAVSMPVIDSIIRSKRKTIVLVVTAEAKLVVRAPYRTSLKYIEDIVKSRQKWINEKQKAVRLRNEAHIPRRLVDGGEFLFLGETYRLEMVKGRPHVELQPGRLILQAQDAEEGKAALEAWYRKQAKRVFVERTAYYSDMTGLRPKSVSVSGAKRRWGSCGPKNTLNFAWRLVMAPVRVIDYVVVHELAHIEFKNHSADFWRKVADIMPGYGECRAWLSRNQKLLELFQ